MYNNIVTNIEFKKDKEKVNGSIVSSDNEQNSTSSSSENEEGVKSDPSDSESENSFQIVSLKKMKNFKSKNFKEDIDEKDKTFLNKKRKLK